MKAVSITIVLGCMTLVTAAMTLYARDKTDPKAPAFKPEAQVSDLMHLNKDLYKSIQDDLKSTPKWEEMLHNARIIAEIGNVLQYHHPTTEKDWWDYARGYREGARKLAAAIEKKDTDAAVGAHAALFSSCKSCHRKYRK